MATHIQALELVGDACNILPAKIVFRLTGNILSTIRVFVPYPAGTSL